MEAIVLAGGFGMRLASRIDGIPKPMAPVAGRPFLEILLAQLRGAGCTSALLSVGHLHEAIQDHFGASFRGMTLDYAIESVPLGTGGAIRLALAQATDDSVLVLNGDTFLDADYAAMMRFHRDERAAVTIAVAPQPDLARYGGVAIENGRIVAFQEKGRSGPGWISAGAYVFNRNIEWPPSLPERFSIEKDFFVPEIARLAPAAYEVSGYFLDIGIPEDLDRAQSELTRFLVPSP
ncbi:MAG: nucleotidyltransferase family protein [Terracidiphilus sp.]|jgi:D-glycero-alpha-D-manno-heptose 1-phosphate guanylyltransferase